MIFDQLCGLVERHFPELSSILKDAKIFHFPARAHEKLPKKWENYDFVYESFFLPFKTVAVEDTASVVILIDYDNDAKGLGVTRRFIECLPATVNKSEFGNRFDLSDEIETVFREEMKKLDGSFLITVGTIKVEECRESSFGVRGDILGAAMCNKDNIIFAYSESDFKTDLMLKEYAKSSLINAMTALEEIAYFNTPDRFILKEEPIKVKTRGNKKEVKIVRSHDRPRFILLTPKEIRKKMGISEGSHLQVGYERRRHYRTLRSERFTHKRGKIIPVSASWVGPKQITRGNIQYTIIFDI